MITAKNNLFISTRIAKYYCILVPMIHYYFVLDASIVEKKASM